MVSPGSAICLDISGTERSTTALAAITAAPRAEISSLTQRSSGRATHAAMMRHHSCERCPPPMILSFRIGVPVSASRAARLRPVSKQMPSSSERYMAGLLCEPVKPTMAPRASGSQCGDWTAFQYGKVSSPSAPGRTCAAACSSSGSGAPWRAGSPSAVRNHCAKWAPEFCTTSNT